MDVKNKIMASFFSLLDHQSFESINVRMIMNKANLSRTLFYQYFDSKEDLAQVALEYQTSQIVQHLVPIADQGKTVYKKQALVGVQSVLDQEPRFSMLMKIQGNSFNLLNEFKNQIKEVVLRKIAAANPQANNDNIEYYAELFTVSMLTTLQWYFTKKGFSLEKLVDYIDTAMFKGLYDVIDL